MAEVNPREMEGITLTVVKQKAKDMKQVNPLYSLQMVLQFQQSSHKLTTNERRPTLHVLGHSGSNLSDSRCL